MSAAPLVIWSPRFADHVTPPGHPERPERADVMARVAREWAEAGGGVAEPAPAAAIALAAVHDSAHLDRITATAGRAVALDPDTFTSPDSHEVALLAAGAAMAAVDHAMDARHPAFAFVRPPGHHAERNRAMGFCLYNNVAVAAAHALARGAGKVAIVDIDVHHGNGTQEIFYADPRVLYISTHQSPFYPGTGAPVEVGAGEGHGFTVNVPMEAGSTDGDYDRVTSEIVLPVLHAYAPDLVLVSAGYDAHQRDPLGGMRMSTDGFVRSIHRLHEVATRHCGGALMLVTEGGYDLDALEACLLRTLQTLAAPDPAPAPPDVEPTYRSRAACDASREALRRYWPTLAAI